MILYDLDAQSLTPDQASLARVLEEGPRVPVLAHLYGVPVDVVRVARQAAANGTVVLEDAAQGIGAMLRGQPVGSFGSAAVLSFGRGKGLTGGSGGALLANDQLGEALLEEAGSSLEGARAGWPDLGRACAQWIFGRPAIYALPAALPFLRLGQTVFRTPEPPRTLSRAAANMIFRNWKSAFTSVSRRRALAARLISAARGNRAWRTLSLQPETVPGYLRLPLLAENNAREVLLSRKAVKLGIAPGYPLPLVRLPGFAQHCVNADEAFPGADLLAERLFTLPTHERLSDRDVSGLQRWLADAGHSQLARKRDKVVAGEI